MENDNTVGLTIEEKSILDLTADIWNQYHKLAAVRPDESRELQLHIHNIQHMIAWRVARRLNPEIWT